MIEEINGTILTIEGKRYDVIRNLECLEEASGRQKTYLRTPTKVKVFKELKGTDPELFERITHTYWWSQYEDAVNGVTTPVNNESEGMSLMNNESLTKLINAIEGISDMHKIEFAEKKVEEYAKEFIQKTYGKLPTTYDVRTSDDKIQRIDGITHKIFPTVCKLVNMGEPVMLVGPAGTGKNFMVEQIAKALGGEFFYSSTLTQEFKLTGYQDANGIYHPTPLRKAMEFAIANPDKPAIFMLDEFDGCSADVAIMINGLLANGYMDFPDKMLRVGDNFKVVCAANTFGNGADMIYAGRNVLDGATLDRFITIKMDYDENLETQLCPDEDLKRFIYDIRRSAKNNHINAIVGMRCLSKSYKMLMNGFDKDTIVQGAILKGMGEDDINVLKGGLDNSNPWYKHFKYVK